jgi:hypothetical protein
MSYDLRFMIGIGSFGFDGFDGLDGSDGLDAGNPGTLFNRDHHGRPGGKRWAFLVMETGRRFWV